MKKLFLVIISTFLFCNLYAQQRDFAFFNHRIDSLTQIYSTKEWQEMIYGNYFDYTNLNVKGKEKLIIKVRKLFEQEEYANLYRYGHRIIYDMWWMYPNNNSLEIKQKLIELYLQYYFYPGTSRIIDSYRYDKNRNLYFTKKSKQRIIELLENKKTDKEYLACLNYRKTLSSSITVSEHFIKLLIKERNVQNDTIIQQIRDSVYTEYVSAATKKDLESLQLEPDLIRMIGLLDMKECIPALKKNMESCIANMDTCDFGTCRCSRDDIKAYRYALAKLGDKEQRQYILDNLMNIGNNNYSDEKYFDRKDFSYFRDDEMIWRYIKINYSSGKMIGILSDVYISASLKTMNDVYPFIKNIPKELIFPDFATDKEENQWAQSLYDWVMANKDKVEFDYEGEKKFPW